MWGVFFLPYPQGKTINVLSVSNISLVKYLYVGYLSGMMLGSGIQIIYYG